MRFVVGGIALFLLRLIRDDRFEMWDAELGFELVPRVLEERRVEVARMRWSRSQLWIERWVVHRRDEWIGVTCSATRAPMVAAIVAASTTSCMSASASTTTSSVRAMSPRLRRASSAS